MITVEVVTETVTHSKVTSRVCDGCQAAMLPDQNLDKPGDSTVYVDMEFIKTVLDEAPKHTSSGWRINDLCEACAMRLRQILLDQGFVVEDFSHSWD